MKLSTVFSVCLLAMAVMFVGCNDEAPIDTSKKSDTAAVEECDDCAGGECSACDEKPCTSENCSEGGCADCAKESEGCKDCDACAKDDSASCKCGDSAPKADTDVSKEEPVVDDKEG